MTLTGHEIDVRLTREARRHLETRDEPLFVEIEVLFSCLVRKRVHVGVRRPDAPTFAVGPNIEVSIRPVVYEGCDPANPESTLGDIPMDDASRLMPTWLSLDVTDGKWSGSFGW